MPQIEPYLLGKEGAARQASRLPRVHDRFNEEYLQDLLEKHPELLPVNAFRPDIGELQCIGREVPTRDSGNIDNLYLSSAGYVVVVETKLWRNPQGRREVVSQVLDYVKDMATRDFDWLESVWSEFSSAGQTLLESMSHLLDKELDESEVVKKIRREAEGN